VPKKPDVIVVGGGIVGCAIAYRLARENLAVTLLERGEIGREASWAGAGILSPQRAADCPGPLGALCDASFTLYEPLVRELRGLAPTDPELHITGLLALGTGDTPTGGRLDRDEALTLQPGLGPEVREALFFPNIAQVRSPRMTIALSEAAAQLGVEIRTETPVTGFLRVPGRVTGVRTPRGDLYAGVTVLAAGAWSGGCARLLDLDLPVHPVKGQVLLTEAPPGFCRLILLKGNIFIIPRTDGRLLIGSTFDETGFETSVTLGTVRDLVARVSVLLPGVADLPLVMSWAGLRPGTPDGLPFIGPGPMEGLLVATGHFQNGILLAPVTAELVTDLIVGRDPSIPLEPFDPMR
jgi:glycine oxidase